MFKKIGNFFTKVFKDVLRLIVSAFNILSVIFFFVPGLNLALAIGAALLTATLIIGFDIGWLEQMFAWAALAIGVMNIWSGFQQMSKTGLSQFFGSDLLQWLYDTTILQKALLTGVYFVVVAGLSYAINGKISLIGGVGEVIGDIAEGVGDGIGGIIDGVGSGTGSIISAIGRNLFPIVAGGVGIYFVLKLINSSGNGSQQKDEDYIYE